ncbi:IS5 family transposase [Streptomyces sp. NPDC005533]|uniref:IS5 family transposase n=1 Tax=Streptomyces sp. NPDC005533 TaxID=3364723 RepID=UPI00367DAB7A
MRPAPERTSRPWPTPLGASCRSCDYRLPRSLLRLGRGDLTGAEWERMRPFLPVSNRRCGRWRNHRQLIDGILHRVRTGVHWRGLPERFGPWKTVYKRHRLWSADGTWERLLQQVQAEADATGEIAWDISVDSTFVRAHRHAAGARNDPPPALAPKTRHRGRAASPAWRRWCGR